MAYGFNNYHVNLVDGLKGHVTPEWFALLLTLEIILEILAAMYIADVVSGVVHLHLDYSISDDEELKQYSFKTKGACGSSQIAHARATPFSARSPQCRCAQTSAWSSSTTTRSTRRPRPTTSSCGSSTRTTT